MTIEGGAPPRDYEEALRALGLIFDEGNFSDVMVVELSSGFGVTALRHDGDLLDAGAEGHYRLIETHFSDEEVAEASMKGSGHRGTRHRANRNEQAFRVLGRYIVRVGGSHVMIVDQGDSFLLRMLMEGEQDMPHRFLTISSSQLEVLRVEAQRERGGG